MVYGALPRGLHPERDHQDASLDADAIKARLTEIAGGIGTYSGAPVADSVAFRAANLIDGTPEAYKAAAETLTIGLSAAN